LAEAIQWIQSLRAMGVMSDHNARAFGAAARAFRRSAGTLGSGSSPDGAISSVTRRRLRLRPQLRASSGSL